MITGNATKFFLPYPAGAIAVVISGTINGVEAHNRVACATGEPHTYSCIEYRVPAVFYP